MRPLKLLFVQQSGFEVLRVKCINIVESRLLNKGIPFAARASPANGKRCAGDSKEDSQVFDDYSQ